MSYGSAKSKFEKAKGHSADMGIMEIAEGLLNLTRAIEDDLEKLDRKIRDIENKVRSLR